MLAPPMPREWSLSWRLAWRMSVLMFGAIALAAAAVAWRTIATLHDLDDSALQQQVSVVAASLPPEAGKHGPFAVPAAVAAPFQNSDGDNVFIVYGRNRAILATSDATQAAQATVFMPRTEKKGFFRLPLLAGHPQGMVGYALPTGPLWVVVLQGREQTSALANSLMASFLAGAVWLLLPIGLAAMLVSVFTLRRGLRPLLRVSTAAGAVGGQAGVRLPLAGLPREVTPLVEAVNEALTRLEQTIATQRRFMAEAAHGLRTPLAVLTARLDSLEHEPQAAALRRDVDRMSRLVGQLLGMARLESLPLDVAQTVSLHAVAVAAIADLAPLGLRRGVALALFGGPSATPVHGNRAALLLAVTNLIENAIAHAPSGSIVEIVLMPAGGISVRDRGPGVAPEDAERILRPFERGALAAEGGAGLGLAIVSRIAAAHGGELKVETRVGGGGAFTLTVGECFR
jgi:signal transduction histidine kinase